MTVDVMLTLSIQSILLSQVPGHCSSKCELWPIGLLFAGEHNLMSCVYCQRFHSCAACIRRGLSISTFILVFLIFISHVTSLVPCSHDLSNPFRDVSSPYLSPCPAWGPILIYSFLCVAWHAPIFLCANDLRTLLVDCIFRSLALDRKRCNRNISWLCSYIATASSGLWRKQG